MRWIWMLLNEVSTHSTKWFMRVDQDHSAYGWTERSTQINEMKLPSVAEFQKQLFAEWRPAPFFCIMMQVTDGINRNAIQETNIFIRFVQGRQLLKNLLHDISIPLRHFIMVVRLVLNGRLDTLTYKNESRGRKKMNLKNVLGERKWETDRLAMARITWKRTTHLFNYDWNFVRDKSFLSMDEGTLLSPVYLVHGWVVIHESLRIGGVLGYCWCENWVLKFAAEVIRTRVSKWLKGWIHNLVALCFLAHPWPIMRFSHQPQCLFNADPLMCWETFAFPQIFSSPSTSL